MLRQRLCRSVHPIEVRLPRLLVHEKWDDEDNHVCIGNCLGVVGGGFEVAAFHDLRKVLIEMSLTRERNLSLVDKIDSGLVDVDTGHIETGAGELDSERQTDFAESNYSDVFHF